MPLRIALIEYDDTAQFDANLKKVYRGGFID